MAERLIDQWRLAALRVRMDLSSHEPMVSATVEAFQDGRKQELLRATAEPHTFGLPDGVAPGDGLTLQVPVELTDSIASVMVEQLNGEAALWLRLVPPYGLLGAVPWEEAVVGATGLPLLRVPDRLPLPTDPGRRWRVAVAVDASRDRTWSADAVAAYVEAYVMRMSWSMGADLEVHVFSDAESYPSLAGRRYSVVTHVHDPANAAGAARHEPWYADWRSPESAPPRSSWGSWITQGLAGRSVRALHVISDAIFDADQPLLAVSPDPVEPSGRGTCRFVTGDDVVSLADSVGASTLSFGSPPGNSSDAATRMMADEVGQRRSGVTFYTSVGSDPDADLLAEVHRFVAHDDAPLPRAGGLFVYVQPERAARTLRDPMQDLSWAVAAPPGMPHARHAAEALTPGLQLERAYATSATVPRWVAASERYIASSTADLLSTLGVSATGGSAYTEGAFEAMAAVRQVLRHHGLEDDDAPGASS